MYMNMVYRCLGPVISVFFIIYICSNHLMLC
uniref:Uncharacterized protein n=2 Tax=Anguilla anguilla TaxID=7936 RepID=A0A0E9VEN4_ANGAN